MAYAAVTSLYHTIDLLLTSSRTSSTDSTEKILKNARWGAERLQKHLREYDTIKNSSEGVLAADARIREEARRLEDLIESKASAQFHSQSQCHGRFSLNLDHLRHDIDCFLGRVERLRAEYLKELHKPQEAPAAVAVSSSTSKPDRSGPVRDDVDNMVGFSDLFLQIRDKIIVNASDQGKRFAFTGMAGIGKTTFVKKLFHDSLIRKNFQHRAFVRVGQKYVFEDILRDILAQLNIKIILGKNEDIDRFFKNRLRHKKYLIVLDDVWDQKLETHFNDILNTRWSNQSGWFLVTSRIDGKRDIKYRHRMPLLNEDQSWELLQRKVFGELQECPRQLVKAGKKIAENCEGLPLLIITVAQLLFTSPMNPEFWDKVAKMQNSTFEDAMDKIYEVLLPSFHYLDQNSKACFLYMCVFPKDYVVWRSKVNNLWLAEGFADGVPYVLDDIVSSNLVVIRQLNWNLEKAKACNLHIVNRHLSRREAENNKFIFILKSYVADGDGSSEGIDERPHLAIYHNTLLAIKEVLNSIAQLSTVRSVLCTGPYHHYQVPVCFDLRLLRVLDAVTIRFYEFPIEVVKLIQLRYLSLTTNANLPPSIAKLWFLEYLIVHQHLSIISHASVADSSSYVPMEIWELEQLKHLQIIGRNLPHPRPGNILPNLTQLLDVGVQSCAAVVLESLPKLEKLRIQIESAPDVAQTMSSSFDHIFGHENLKSLGSVVVNPKLLPISKFQPRFYLSSSLERIQKLSLNGFGYPWKDMSQIAKLPRLKVLKLKCYAFRGEKWEAKQHQFRRLEHLLIEDTDLVQWTGGDDQTFPSFSHLTMKNCHKLHQFPLVKSLRQIELVDCNPLAEIIAKKIVGCQVKVTCSWT